MTTQLACDDRGEGPAFVLLHAFPLDRSLWHAVVDPLVAEGWRVITPDLPGFGESVRTVGSVDDMASAVAALLDALGVHSAVIGGCSMGGYVALSFAAQFALRTAGLVLVDTKASADGDEVRANRARIAEQVESAGSTAALAATQPAAMFSAVTLAQRPEVVAWLQETIRAQRPVGVAAAQRAMAGRPERFETLAALRVPVLCIRGAEDALATADDQSRMASAAPDVLEVTVPGAGHLVPVEDPGAFVDALVPFLRRIRTPAC